jgi:hypothetical protein
MTKNGWGRARVSPSTAFVDGHAEDVGRQKIAGKLDPVEAQAEQLGEDVGQRGLADAGQILDQQVAARDQAGQRQPDRVPLAEPA